MANSFLRTFVKILASCVLYSLISHIVLNVNYGEQFNILMIATRSFLIYSALFLVYAAVPLCIAFLFAKLVKRNRSKPVSLFINSGLTFGWMIALFFLWGGWYGSTKVSQVGQLGRTEQSISNADILRMAKEEVERISRQTPIVIDSQTNLISVSFFNESAFFIYQFHSLFANDIDKNMFQTRIKEISRNRFCTDSESEAFRNVASDIEINWKYIDSVGEVISNISMKGSQC